MHRVEGVPGARHHHQFGAVPPTGSERLRLGDRHRRVGFAVHDEPGRRDPPGRRRNVERGRPVRTTSSSTSVNTGSTCPVREFTTSICPRARQAATSSGRKAVHVADGRPGDERRDPAVRGGREDAKAATAGMSEEPDGAGSGDIEPTTSQGVHHAVGCRPGRP